MSYSKYSNVPINLLPGIGCRTAKVLQKLEIKTIGQFKQMPEKILIELFGPSIKRPYYQTQGIIIRKSVKKNTNRTFFSKLKLAQTFASFL